MPTYNFKNSETGEIFDMFFTSYTKKDEYLKEHPEVTQIIGAPGIVSGVAGTRKPDESFRDVLRNIDRRAGRHSKVNTW